VPSLPSPVLRAMQGLADNSGRTIVIAGPPTSGKSALLESLRQLLKARNARIVELRGSYRSRSIPYGALDGLRGSPTGESSAPNSEAGPEAENGEVAPPVPMAPLGYIPERLPRSGRRSRGERAHTSFLGQPVRGRSANEGNPDAYWAELLEEFRRPDPHPVAILVDDGAIFDPDSREFVTALTRKARYRPLLVAIALDTSVPGFMTWEDALLGRGDVDWVRFTESNPDPREAHRLKSLFDDIPAVTQRVVGYVALLGGNVGEVVLSRVSRLSFPQLGEALLPATGVGLVKVQDGKVVIPHHAWIPLTGDLLPEKQRREMHLEIARALAALSPEPSLARRTEIARHYYEWYPGPMALHQLLEAAELNLQLLAFDSAEELLTQAIECLAGIEPAERTILEPELRLLHARALFPAGRLEEAVGELRAGLSGALQAGIPSSALVEWVEPLVLLMRVVGPRPSLATALGELAERCHDSEAIEVEVLFEALIAEFHHERQRLEEARSESRRAAVLARKIPDPHLQAMALLAVALSRIEGTPEEQQLAERFLVAARLLLGRSRRWELDNMAQDLEARLLELRGSAKQARLLRERSLSVLQRQKLLAVEIYHQLGLAESLLDQGTAKGVESPLARARTISETLHLLPPSPSLLRTWLLEGRLLAQTEAHEAARERWSAIADEPGADATPRLRAEAMLRLVLLDHATGREDEAATLLQKLRSPENSAALPPAWRDQLDTLEAWVPESRFGGGALPPPASGKK
jgi:tetratricopeptide (TPR) repeat protein/energy-coupling factor transporter ATP-binding protein EcfA2